MKSIFKNMIFFSLVISLYSCSSFKAQRLDDKESDEKSLSITNKWLTKDTEIAVNKILKKMKKHKGFQRYLEDLGKTPKVFISEVQNDTSEAYFPIEDFNDELLENFSETGEFILIDNNARDAILKELKYQNDGMVDPREIKTIGKQSGADLIIMGAIRMKPASREGKETKQYTVNIRMTDLEKGIEVFRGRAKVNKYSESSSSGW